MTNALINQKVFSLEQAVGAEPSLSALRTRIRESLECMAAIKPLIPPTLFAFIQAGPLTNGEWCMLVSNPAAATKVRQLLPAIRQRLSEERIQVTSVRLKVQTPSVRPTR